MLGQQSQLDANTNRTIPTSQYDTQGNQLQVAPYTMQYDGENRLISAAQSNGAAITYDYDGAGQRVRQTNPDGTATVFVYDALGQMAYQVTSGSQAAPPCTTCYLSWDHLGTTRMVTDQNTNLISFHDYLVVRQNSVGVGFNVNFALEPEAASFSSRFDVQFWSGRPQIGSCSCAKQTPERTGSDQSAIPCEFTATLCCDFPDVSMM